MIMKDSCHAVQQTLSFRHKSQTVIFIHEPVFFRVNLYLFVSHRQAPCINEIRRLHREQRESRLTNGFPITKNLLTFYLDSSKVKIN